LFDDCSLLNSKYINYRVPFDIRAKGEEEVEKYRKWFITNLYLIESKPDAFAMRHHARWGFELNPKAIIKENSGSYRFDNENLEELKSRIDIHLDQAREYYYSSDKNMFILKKFAKDTYLAFNQEKIENNNTELSDEELKIFLKEYDIKYKRPLKKDLIEYYRVKFNPMLQFEQNLLEQLSFNLCTKCAQRKIELELNEKRRMEGVKFAEIEDIFDDSPRESIPHVYFNFNIIEDELLINF
jgi:hypothetical protein